MVPLGGAVSMLRTLSLSVLLIGILQLSVYRGGNADWPPLILTICSALSLLLASFAGSAKNPDRPLKPHWSWTGIALWLGWLGWLVFQITPLTRDNLALISPYSLPFHDAVAAAGGHARYTLSVAPAASLAMLLASLGYFLLYLAVALHAQDRQSTRLILWTLFIAACAQALYAALHELAAVAHPFLDAVGRHQHVATGSFANRNHFAAFCTLGFAAGLALMLGRSSSKVQASGWRTRLKQSLDTLSSSAVPIRIGLLGIVIGVVLSRSRMGNTALAVGISVYALVWLLSAREKRGFLGAFLLFASIGLADVLLISDQFGLERVLQRIETTDLDKEVRTVGNAMSKELMQQTSLMGAGMGSYPDVAETVRPAGLFGMFYYAHNDYYQFAIESGRVGLALLGALLVYHLLAAITTLNSRRSQRRAVAAAAVMVITAGLLHATVEFNFQIPGYAAEFVCFLALIANTRPRRQT